MRVEIETAEGVEHTTELEEHAKKQLRHVERRFGERITKVMVYLKDERPGKGGVDKKCHMEARPAGIDPVTVESLESTAFDAVRMGAEKLEKALARRLGDKP